jgi:hypothetical protein
METATDSVARAVSTLTLFRLVDGTLLPSSSSRQLDVFKQSVAHEGGLCLRSEIRCGKSVFKRQLLKKEISFCHLASPQNNFQQQVPPSICSHVFGLGRQTT